MHGIYDDEKWIGYKNNRLTVIGVERKKDKNGKELIFWKVVCDCGTEKIVSPRYVIQGKTKSCGCYKREGFFVTKHGKSKTRLYNTWSSMVNRCKPGGSSSKDYGDRGIKVCEEWWDFEKFSEWAMKSGYTDQLTIERIDVNGNYEPGNCTWIPMELQARNKRNTIYVDYKGKRMPLAEACELACLPYKIVSERIFVGKWSAKNALETGIIRK